MLELLNKVRLAPDGLLKEYGTQNNFLRPKILVHGPFKTIIKILGLLIRSNDPSNQQYMAVINNTSIIRHTEFLLCKTYLRQVTVEHDLIKTLISRS